MTYEWVTARFPDSEMERITNRALAMARVDEFAKPNSRLRLKAVGGTYGRWLDEREGDRRFRARSLTMPVGEKLICQRESDMEQLSIRKVKTLVIPDLHAAPALGLILAETYARFGNPLLRDGGLWYCRFIAGTRTVSKHGYRDQEGDWLGAADDLFVTSGGMPQLEQVGDFMFSRMVEHDFTGANMIVNRRISTVGVNSNKPRSYGGDPHYHVHGDVPAGVPCIGAEP